MTADRDEPAPAPTPRWRAAPAEMLRVVAVEPLEAIYDRRSAQTHVADPLVPALLTALGDDALDAPTLLARLRRDHDLADAGDDPLAAIAARLDELAALGLVARA